jgi:hypothetical protein
VLLLVLEWGSSGQLPPAVLPAFRTFLPTFRQDYPGLAGAQAQLQALRSFCDQSQKLMNGCGRALSSSC